MDNLKKTVYTLQVNGYSEAITRLTFPFMRYWANKIGAELRIITERRFPDYPVTVEKLQVYDLGREAKNDWNIFVDADTLIHPHTLDWTVYLSKDTVAHNGTDPANIRWRYDKYMLRDGRNLSGGNWIAIASDWCLDLWHPPDITADEAISNIFPLVDEIRGGCLADHLIDDYLTSRNIARYGLKFQSLIGIQEKLGLQGHFFLCHLYNMPEAEKIEKIMAKIDEWKVPASIRQYGE